MPTNHKNNNVKEPREKERHEKDVRKKDNHDKDDHDSEIANALEGFAKDLGTAFLESSLPADGLNMIESSINSKIEEKVSDPMLSNVLSLVNSIAFNVAEEKLHQAQSEELPEILSDNQSKQKIISSTSLGEAEEFSTTEV
jgi:hypothetical protein